MLTCDTLYISNNAIIHFLKQKYYHDNRIQITANQVTYDRDIKDATKKYAFTDGVGTISTQLRDKVG